MMSYIFFTMRVGRLNAISAIIFYLICIGVSNSSIDFILGREYHGWYSVKQEGKTFDYLDERAGEIVAYFYGTPNRESLNSVQFLLLDPKYEDGKAVLMDIKGIIDVSDSSESWTNNSHSLSYSLLWHQRQDDPQMATNVSTTISFKNLPTQDYQSITISIKTKGTGFDVTAELTYYNQLVSTMAYSLYVSGVVSVVILSAFRLLKLMDAPHFVFAGKFSLLAVSMCNIEDFSQTMSHIQSIMSSQSGYLFFILPSLAYIILFIIFDMKMLFLVWRNNPQLIRKKLTAFYIQFYLGLFLYLALTYFFADQEWMILLRTLVLLPQIVHNIRLGHRPNFTPAYIFGFVGARLLLPIYERGCPANRFHLTPSPSLVLAIIAAYALEVVLIGLQNRLGSRFFLPKRFLPNYHNYRLKLHRDEQTREMECAICLQCLFQSAPAAGLAMNESMRQEMLPQVTIMNTPCDHKFHQECLSQWMEVKLECPSCRAPLPPL